MSFIILSPTGSSGFKSNFCFPNEPGYIILMVAGNQPANSFANHAGGI